MNKMELLEKINSSAYLCRDAWDHLYHGKTFVAYNNGCNFFKTRRGAEGYIKRQRQVVYYDEYSMEMVTCGAGAEIFEIKENELVDYKTNKKIWYSEMYDAWYHYYGRSCAFDVISQSIEQYQPTTEIVEYMETLKAEIIASNWVMPAYEEEQPEPAPTAETVETMAKNETVDETKAVEAEGVTVEVVYNEEKNGIELHFSNKPAPEILAKIKAIGFRWSRRGFWYAKQNAETLEYAEKLTGSNNAEKSEPVTVCENQEDKSKKSVSPAESEKSHDLTILDDIQTYTIAENISRLENNNSFARYEDIDHTKELQKTLTPFNEKMKNLINQLPYEKQHYYIRKTQALKKQYTNDYSAYLKHKGENPSWIVTGRSGINERKYNRAMNRWDQLLNKLVDSGKELDNLISKAKKEVADYKKSIRIAEINQQLANGKTATIKREKKLINVSGFHTGIFTDANFNTTAYNVNDQFYIIELWGAWRYYDKNGFEIKTDFKFKTLTDAKKYAGIYAEKLAS